MFFKPGNAVDVLRHRLLQQARHDHAAARRQLDGRFGAPDRNPGTVSCRSSTTKAFSLRELRHFGRNVQADASFGQHDRRKPEAHTERFELELTLPSRSRATGNGNSPPAKNFADSPETAVRFGSANMRTMPGAFERLDNGLRRRCPDVRLPNCAFDADSA